MSRKMELNNTRKISTSLFLAFMLLCYSLPIYGSDSDDLFGGSISVSSCEGLFAGGGSADDNLMASIVGLCLPGVIKNLDRLEQNECEKILCEYKAAQDGVSPILCAKKSAYNACMITGEGFDVIEGLLIGNLRKNIVAILENPLILGVQVVKLAAKQFGTCPAGPGTCSTPISKISAIGLSLFEVANAFMTLQSLFDKISEIGEEEQTACEQLADVRADLEQIIADYNTAVAAQERQSTLNVVDTVGLE